MRDLLSDRATAGRRLAERLHAYHHHGDAVVLALPRGGVPVGYEIAHALNLPLDVFVVRKIGVPQHPELAMGAIASGGSYNVNRNTIAELGITNDEFLAVFARELDELHRRERAYRDGRPPLVLENKEVLLVDDGLATGSTMRVAIDAVRRHRPAKIVVTVPVTSSEARDDCSAISDEFVTLVTPEPFRAVGLHYTDFREVGDTDVRALLERANSGGAPSGV